MKKAILLFIVLMTIAPAWAQKDQILGIWWNEDRDGKIEIYKTNDRYFGKIIWIEADELGDMRDPKTDFKNPKDELRSRPIVGINVLKKLKWDKADQEWKDGSIYDPKTGNTYEVYARLENKNTLYLKGFIGFSLLGRSTLWKRVAEMD